MNQELRWSVAVGVSLYYVTSLLALLGLWFGANYIPRQPAPRPTPPGYLSAFRAWDGTWYEQIARDGYAYDPNRRSSVAFFPAYPASVAAANRWLGIPVEYGLIIVSHLCLMGAFATLACYRQSPGFQNTSLEEPPPAQQADLTGWTLLAFGLWPTSFFFRMAYSESLFLFATLLAMLGMKRRWHPLLIAVLVGLVTACRPVGVALIPVFLLHLWRILEAHPRRLRAWLLRVACLGPLACWGLLAYMFYLDQEFGDPLAFAKTQRLWHRRPQEPLPQHLLSLLTGEPLWSVYVPGSPAYWAKFERNPDPLFSLQFANPIYFLLTAALVAWGAWKRWLDRSEWLLSAGLLFIPYVTHSYQTVMTAQGRYAAAAFPLYLTLGHILLRLPPPVAALLCVGSAALMILYAALFSAWHNLI